LHNTNQLTNFNSLSSRDSRGSSRTQQVPRQWGLEAGLD